MTNISDRLRITRKKKGLSQQALADLCDLSQALVSKIEKGKANAGASIIPLAKALDVDPEWLANGEAGASDEVVPSRMRMTAYSNVSELDPKEYTMMRFYNNIAVYAGNSGEDSQSEPEYYDMPFRNSFYVTRGVKPEKCRMFRVRGKSMEPTYKDNSVVAVNTEVTQIIDGEPYLIRYRTLSIKYLSIRGADGALIIRSENPDKTSFPDVIVTEDNAPQVEVIGRIFWYAVG